MINWTTVGVQALLLVIGMVSAVATIRVSVAWIRRELNGLRNLPTTLAVHGEKIDQLGKRFEAVEAWKHRAGNRIQKIMGHLGMEADE